MITSAKQALEIVSRYKSRDKAKGPSEIEIARYWSGKSYLAGLRDPLVKDLLEAAYLLVSFSDCNDKTLFDVDEYETILVAKKALSKYNEALKEINP